MLKFIQFNKLLEFYKSSYNARIQLLQDIRNYILFYFNSLSHIDELIDKEMDNQIEIENDFKMEF
jgi:hypothetical protein